jgi:Mn-dependent DtxR family transcriptional regulator
MTAESVPVPVALIRDRHVNHVAVRIYAEYVAAVSLHGFGQTMITVQEIADRLGIDAASVRRANHALTTAGWITRDIRANHALTTPHSEKITP